MGGEAVIRDKRGIRGRMVPVALYQRVWADQSLAEAAELLLGVQMHAMSDDDTDRGRRALLVFDRGGRFIGLLRARDIVRAMVRRARASRRGNADAETLAGLAEAVARIPVARIVRPPPSIDAGRSVLDAARMIAARRLSHLAVMQSGKLIGLLRAEDLYQEVAAS